jgi:hypothetical protein
MKNEQKPSEVPVGKYTFSQELRDMLRAAYRRYACNCHFEEIEHLIVTAPHNHGHQRFFEMVSEADKAVRGEKTHKTPRSAFQARTRPIRLGLSDEDHEDHGEGE